MSGHDTRANDLPPDPEKSFGSPEDIVRDPGLALSRKIDLLDRWAFAVQHRLDAAAEGMPVTSNREAEESELLRRIGKAKVEICRVSE